MVIFTKRSFEKCVDILSCFTNGMNFGQCISKMWLSLVSWDSTTEPSERLTTLQIRLCGHRLKIESPESTVYFGLGNRVPSSPPTVHKSLRIADDVEVDGRWMIICGKFYSVFTLFLGAGLEEMMLGIEVCKPCFTTGQPSSTSTAIDRSHSMIFFMQTLYPMLHPEWDWCYSNYPLFHDFWIFLFRHYYGGFKVGTKTSAHSCKLFGWIKSNWACSNSFFGCCN